MNYNFTDNKIYNVSDVENVLKNISLKDIKGNNKKLFYYNIPCAFDIETSSFYREPNTDIIYNYEQIKQLKLDSSKLEKLGLMYIWQFGINGFCFIGRTWNEFKELLNKIEKILQLNDNKRIIIYVHNLSFEFQFLCKMFNWSKIFAIDLRKPLYAIYNGFEFRCSYLLSGYSLQTVAKNLTKYKIEKMVGDLDYRQIRHEKTPLTDKEIRYCINDIKIVMLYILEYIETVKNIHFIPLTKTNGVRKHCRKNCFTVNSEDYKGVNYQYKNFIKHLTIRDLNEFNAMKRAFCGGFTHANANYTNETIENVASYDFTSSYPYVMISEQYPISYGLKIDVTSEEQFNELTERFLCIFDVEFNEIFSTDTYENYISISKCFIRENYSENNGRLVCAKRIAITLTNIDYNIIKNNYSWKNKRIGFLYCYKKGYLPTPFVKSIIELYKKKTILKDIEGKETEYLNSKEMLNSTYGMCVTNPLRNEFIFNNGWFENELTENEQKEMLLKYNTNENRFLFYVWGVFVTAYARRNLFTAITELKHDYIYSDTDSVKFINLDNHKQYFELYNKLVIEKLKAACKFHDIPFTDCTPQNKNGKTKIIGIWDFEGIYEKFKTLGAKRYMIKKHNALNVDGKYYDYSLTVSGVNKKCAIPYLLETYGESGIFENFTNFLHFPENATGKNILTYIDYSTKGKITDLNGITIDFESLSGVHFEPTTYTMNLTVNYLQYITKLKTFKLK